MSDYKDCPNCNNEGWYVVQCNSLQPEQEQCEFCYTEENSIFNTITNLEQQIQTHEATIAELQEDNKWISVDDRLPEYNTPCLVWMDEHKSAITCLWTGEDFSIVRANYTPHGVTHWKPINSPDSKPKLLDHNTSEDCWCEPEEVSDGVFVHKDRH